MNSANIAWMLACSALVLIMTPGLAFFYGGLVKEKNVINTIKMSFIALGVIAVQWALFGYSLAFAPGNQWIGGFDFAFLKGVGLEAYPAYVSDMPHQVFMIFQMMFAIITPALISGAVVGRMKFKTYILFILLWATLVYDPLAHWVWGGGWIGAMGALDFAGGTVVHISAGISALVAAIILGPRKQVKDEVTEEDSPHNVPFVILGTSLLWFGWFGFNAGSALGANELAVLAFVNTMLSAASATVAWVCLEMFHRGKPSAVGASIGAVVGLVTITPAAGFVTAMSSLVMGILGTVISFYGLRFFEKLKLDDTLDVFACHGLGGISGALLTGVFATTAVNPDGANGLLYGNAELMIPQVVSVLAAVALAAILTAVILFVLKMTVGLRIGEEVEDLGLDKVEHNEVAYSYQIESKTQSAAV